MFQDLVPFLVVGGAFLIAFFTFCHYVRQTRMMSRVSPPAALLEHAVGVPSVEPLAYRDLAPQLASVLLYPGSLPLSQGTAEPESELPRRDSNPGELSIIYWTRDSVDTVWDHYRRQLPDWAEALSADSGRELLYRNDHHSCLIRVYGQDGRTLIQATVRRSQYNRNNLFSRN